ncbi:MAG: hypothetical protein DME24_26000 [Verrucomicrobia bacterium]|nr:MAG: hypothetical protein DME24_26000 [Verrucomicrobiota bacterium]
MPSQIVPFDDDTKHQAPNTKLQRNTNIQTPGAIPAVTSPACLRAGDFISSADRLGLGSLEFPWFLEFGIWCFAFHTGSSAGVRFFPVLSENFT